MCSAREPSRCGATLTVHSTLGGRAALLVPCCGLGVRPQQRKLFHRHTVPYFLGSPSRPRGRNIEYFLPELRAHRAANMLATQIAPKRTRRVSRPKPCHRSSWQSGGSVMTRLRRARRVNSWPLSGADRTSSKPRRRPSLTRKGHHPDRDPAVQRPPSIHCWPRTC